MITDRQKVTTKSTGCLVSTFTDNDTTVLKSMVIGCVRLTDVSVIHTIR